MRAVSREFIKALNASETQYDFRVFMIFREFYSICTANANAYLNDHAMFAPYQLCDNRLSSQNALGQPKRYLNAVDPDDPNPPTADGTWYPRDFTQLKQVNDLSLVGSIHTPQFGWWSPTKTDSVGDCNFWITVTMSSQQAINAMFYVGDPDWGYPVNYDLYVSTSGVQTLVKQVKNNKTYFMFDELGQYYVCDTILINIRKWSRIRSYVKCYEFVPVDGFDVTERLISAETLEERNYTDSSATPYGNSSKNKLTLALENIDGAFYSRNYQSPFYRKLRPNTKFRFYLGLNIDNKRIEWTNRGAFYSIGQFDTSMAKADVNIEAWDKGQILDNKNFVAPVIYSLTQTNPNTVLSIIDKVVQYYNTSYGDLINVQNLVKFDDIGHYTSDWNNIFSYNTVNTPDSGVPNAYLKNQTYFKTLNDLAEAVLGWIYFSEEEVLVLDTEFRSKRMFNALINGDFEMPSATQGWNVGSGASLTLAPQNLVFDGTNSAILHTTNQDSGILQQISDPLGVRGKYTFRMWSRVYYGTLRCRVVGRDNLSNIMETYYDHFLPFNGSWNLEYGDFEVTTDKVVVIEVQIQQNGVSQAYAILDDISIATQSVHSFVGEVVPGVFGVTPSTINMADNQDKFTADKLLNQVIVNGYPYRLGVGATVAAYDGDRKIYYGDKFNNAGVITWKETLGQTQTDPHIVQGRFSMVHNNVPYISTVEDNDPSVFLYGPNVGITATSGTWATLNQSYYYRATAINANGESSLGPQSAMSFAPNQQAPQLTIPALQDAQWYRVYRALIPFDINLNVSYVDVGVGPGKLPGWPSDITVVSTTPDNAGNPQLVFLDPPVYSHAGVTPSTNKASKPPVIYLQTPPTAVDGRTLQGDFTVTGDSFQIYTFGTVHEQQTNTGPSASFNIPIGGTYSYTVTYSKTPVYVTTSPTVWSKIAEGYYQTSDGIKVYFDNLNDSGGAVNYIGLILDTGKSQVYPYGATLVFINVGTGILQPTRVAIEAPTLDQTGGLQAISQNQALIDQVGLKTVTLTSDFIQNYPIAKDIADMVLLRWNGPGKEYEIDAPNRAPLHLQLGDKVSIWEKHMAILGEQFIVVRIDTTFDGGASAKIGVIGIN